MRRSLDREELQQQKRQETLNDEKNIAAHSYNRQKVFFPKIILTVVYKIDVTDLKRGICMFHVHWTMSTVL